ncbi:MAG TPA: SAM-dependent methyltransferase [Polyangia bacterium]|nr:SAM-dependent methyltransferase [Polyangia bacterium]
MAEAVSRAAGKLEAAIARFGLARAVRGARAVDVGASTGGFTQTLLAHGAAHVVAVDVGHGQLVDALREDTRVTSMEGVDWKRLSLDEAPGPFDFFTVDVSFVAARNMLRGLAFRLRPGAEGVVLVKPQFELADKQVRGGRVDDENLRRAALEKVAKKAETLGFAVVAHADSPVAGGSGTIEILAHLRFAGRPALLPAEGESRGHKPKPARPAKNVDRLTWFAVVAPGLEEAARRELAALPEATDVRGVDGGVEWRGPPRSGARANLWSRVATRVLVRVGDVEAREFGKLRRGLARLPWAPFVPAGATIAVRATASKCRLYHTGAIAESILLGLGDAVRDVSAAPKAKQDENADDGEEAAQADAPTTTIYVRGVGDRFTFSVDASGELLHRRGSRTEIGAAPLRETLAAGVLALADWSPTEALCDPMCGAGTIPIEAASRALDRAPGLDRAFATARWPLFADHPELERALLEDARARAAATAAAIVVAGSDRDPKLVESARRNAARARVDAHVAFTCADLADARAPAATGLVVVNPPYGRRLGDPRRIDRAYRDLGRALRARFPGWRAAVLVPARTPPAALGLPVTARFPLTNGGLRVALVMCRVE